MDATRALKDAENALREFIAQKLERSFGSGWENECGVTAERLSKWCERKQSEADAPKGRFEEA